MLVAVDANIILSALLGGKSSAILFDGRFTFITTDFTILEVEKFLLRFAKKLHLPISELETAIELLPIQSYSTTFYSHQVLAAEKMISHIDSKDVDILALALHFNCYLWSQDKDFDQTGYTKILKTYQFL